MCHQERAGHYKALNKGKPVKQQILFKRCGQCLDTLPYYKFSKGGSASHGLVGYCKKCASIRMPGTRPYVKRK